MIPLRTRGDISDLIQYKVYIFLNVKELTELAMSL